MLVLVTVTHRKEKVLCVSYNIVSSTSYGNGVVDTICTCEDQAYGVTHSLHVISKL